MYLGSNLFVGHIYGQRAVYCLIYINKYMNYIITIYLCMYSGILG